MSNVNQKVFVEREVHYGNLRDKYEETYTRSTVSMVGHAAAGLFVGLVFPSFRKWVATGTRNVYGKETKQVYPFKFDKKSLLEYVSREDVKKVTYESNGHHYHLIPDKACFIVIPNGDYNLATTKIFATGVHETSNGKGITSVDRLERAARTYLTILNRLMDNPEYDSFKTVVISYKQRELHGFSIDTRKLDPSQLFDKDVENQTNIEISADMWDEIDKLHNVQKTDNQTQPLRGNQIHHVDTDQKKDDNTVPTSNNNAVPTSNNNTRTPPRPSPSPVPENNKGKGIPPRITVINDGASTSTGHVPTTVVRQTRVEDPDNN